MGSQTPRTGLKTVATLAKAWFDAMKVRDLANGALGFQMRFRGPRADFASACDSGVRARGIALVIALMFAFGMSSNCHSTALKLRRPVALAHSTSPRCLLSANRESGSISIIDLESMQVVDEVAIGKRLSALAAVPQTNLFVATDEAAHEVILFSCDGREIQPRSWLSVGHTPVDVQVTADGSRCFVSSLWARQVATVHIDKKESSVKLEATLPLPFAPRKQLLTHDGSRLIVADSFGGQLAVVDTIRMQLESVTRFQACNIRGLAKSLDGERLLVSHQNVNPLAHSTRDDLRWGLVVTNHLRVLDMKTIVSDDNPGQSSAASHFDRRAHGQLVHLGDFGHGAGDPAELVMTKRGKLMIALAGVNRVGIADETELVFEDADVGQRPTALLLDDTTNQVYVANTFSDSVSVVDANSGEVTDEVKLGPVPQLSARDEGERLFFDARLSLDGWMSCHSCHTDGHTSGLVSDTLSDGSFGSPKKILSLLGVSETTPLAWNGQVDTLQQQIKSSLKNTMHHKQMNELEIDRLAAYLSSLQPAPASHLTTAAEATLDGDVLDGDVDVARGAALFERLGCAECHTPPNYTSPDAYDVGLVDERGHREFNPPSLLGVSQRQRFFHDGRAQSLADVFERHQHQIAEPMSPRDVAALVSYLKTI